jgi:ABC-type transport system substrate-binding protein
VDLFAGFGPRLVLTASSGDPAAMATAEAAGGMLRAAGIAAEVQFEDRDLFYGETLADGTWDVAVWTLTGGPGLARAVDLALMFDPAGLPRAGAGFARWGAPGSVVEDGATTRYAGLASRLQSASGLAEAESLLRQAESLLADEVVLLPLAVAGKVGVAYWAGEVQGITVDPAWGIASGIGSWKRVGG